MKTIKEIQDFNRRKIICAVHNTEDYEEALEMELGLSCIISRYDIGMWGHLATKLYYKLDSFRRNKNTGNKDFIFINYGFQKLGESWIGENIDYCIIEKQKLIKELTYTNPEYRGQVQTQIIGKPLTLSRVLQVIGHRIAKIEPHRLLGGCLIFYRLPDYQEFLTWDLTKETLEEQTEETQEAVAKLLGFGEGEND
tara:strand:- start:859 stop:1446 length:588 start_codon:yes stop_codon:yes gene_type:complete